MEIGNLNQRITILEHRTVIDEISNHITKWEETFSLWANVTVKTASETTDAGITKEVQKLEFLVRQSPASLNINSTNSVYCSETVSTTSQELFPFMTTTIT